MPRRLALVTTALTVLALGACSEDPVQPPTSRATATRPVLAASAVPGASTPVLVQVPPSMRHGAFGVDRYLTVPPNCRIAVYAHRRGRVPRA